MNRNLIKLLSFVLTVMLSCGLSYAKKLPQKKAPSQYLDIPASVEKVRDAKASPVTDKKETGDVKSIGEASQEEVQKAEEKLNEVKDKIEAKTVELQESAKEKADEAAAKSEEVKTSVQEVKETVVKDATSNLNAASEKTEVIRKEGTIFDGMQPITKPINNPTPVMQPVSTDVIKPAVAPASEVKPAIMPAVEVKPAAAPAITPAAEIKPVLNQETKENAKEEAKPDAAKDTPVFETKVKEEVKTNVLPLIQQAPAK